MHSPTPDDSKQIIRFGEFALDRRERKLYKGGSLLHLAPKPFDTLEHLILRRDSVVSKEELLEVVWKGVAVSLNSVEHAIGEIRRTLEDDSDSPVYVRTLPRRGYQFIADIESAEAEPALSPDIRNRRRYIAVVIAGVICLISAIAIAYSVLSPSKYSASTVRQLTDSPENKLSPVLVSGEFLYFTQVVGGKYSVVRVPVTGGDTFPVPLAVKNPYLTDIARTRGEFLVRSVTGTFDDDGPLWSVPFAQGPPRQIPVGNAFDACWSPDERRIAIAKGSELMTYESDTGHVRALTKVPGFAWWVRWSPDSRVLRFTVTDARTQLNSLWEVSQDGQNPHRVYDRLDLPRSVCCGNWMSDGRSVVFQGFQDSIYSIWTVTENRALLPFLTVVPHRLTSGPTSFRGPVASPDGKTLFARGQFLRSVVLKYEPKTETLTPFLPDVSIETLTFSYDGHKLAYTTLPESGLWVSQSDGTDRQRIISPPIRVAAPRWSPRGNRIAAMVRKVGGAWRIATIDLSTMAIDEVSRGDTNDTDPTWSDDGEHLFYGTIPTLEAPDRINIKKVHLGTRNVDIVPKSNGMFDPVSSPDGRFIAAIRADTFHLFLFDVQREVWTDITPEMRAGYPVWSRDSKYLYFIDPESTRTSIYRVRIASKSHEKVADLRVRAPNSLFGRAISIDPDGSLLIVSDLSSQQIYALEISTR